MIHPALRGSAAHVLVRDLDAPTATPEVMHHLLRVLRLRDGESITITDGNGSWRECVLVRAGLDLAGDVESLQRRDSPLTVAVAPPKGDRLEWLVAKCTEVGVDRIVLLEAERSVVRWNGERAAKQLDRLRRIVVEASMQSRRVRLPEVSGPLPAADVLRTASIAEPGGEPVDADVNTIAIGPEGGWSPVEVAAARRTVSLGEQILRVETAAVTAAVLMVNASSQRLGPQSRTHP